MPFSKASLPATSIAFKSVSSVKCLGGVVYFSFISFYFLFQIHLQPLYPGVVYLPFSSFYILLDT